MGSGGGERRGCCSLVLAENIGLVDFLTRFQTAVSKPQSGGMIAQAAKGRNSLVYCDLEGWAGTGRRI